MQTSQNLVSDWTWNCFILYELFKFIVLIHGILFLDRFWLYFVTNILLANACHALNFPYSKES